MLDGSGNRKTKYVGKLGRVLLIKVTTLTMVFIPLSFGYFLVRASLVLFPILGKVRS